jgi:hypothetical protein
MKIVVGGLLAGLVLTNVLITPRTLAKKIRGFLSARVPGVQELKVDVRGPRGLRALKGKFHSLVIQGRGSDVTPLADELIVAMEKVRYKNGVGHVREVTARASQFIFQSVPIEKADVVLQDVSFSTKQMVQRRKISDLAFDRATAMASILPSTVDQLGASILRKKGVTDPAIRLLDGFIEVTGKRRLPLGGETELQATGKLIGKGNELHVTDLQVKAGENPLPAPLVSAMAKDINPLYTFDERQRLPFRINLRTVTVTPERLMAEGDFIFKKDER